MKLVIAEKPMLARAIADAIDGTAVNHDGYTEKGDYTIVSAFGHLLTLKEPEDYDAEMYKKWTLSALPIYFDDWGKKPGPGKEERLALIGRLLKDADMVIHAGDPDDEGQYLIDEILQWHDYKGPVMRLATGDTTEAALRRELASMKDNSLFVNAGWSAYARSVADIMVGYNFSRYFSLKNPHIKLLTVGRVQTPTLGLVVTRDMAIENHSRLCYYTVRAKLDLDGHSIDAVLEPPKDDPNLDEGRITDRDYAEELAQALKDQELYPTRVTRKELTEQPPLPFNLVKLQSYCSNKFGYDPSKTLEITQSLRDDFNAITYNRSDCQYLSEEQFKDSSATVRRVIKNLEQDTAGRVFSSLPIDTELHGRAFNDDNITAHTAIIPQNKSFDISKLSEEQRNVYLAIAKYYFAQFLPAAKKERTTLEAPAEGGTVKASSTKVTFPGYLTLIKPDKKAPSEGEGDQETESELSKVEPGTYRALCKESSIEEKETKAPPRYTKASLNEDMTRIAKYVTDPRARALLMDKDKDKKGENGSIGTSATRASIIDGLEQRGFIESKGKQIQSTQLGRELYRILPDELKKPDMTGLWWAEQQSIQEGTQSWTVLTDSVLEMIKKVIKADYPMIDAYRVPAEMRNDRRPLPLGQCPRCGKPIIEGKAGFGCSGYKDGCKFVIWKTARSGMMSRVEVTADMVHQWLSQGWEDEIRVSEGGGESAPTGRKKTRETVIVKKCWSEAKKTSYPARVFLTDEGPASPYGASFGVAGIVREEPKPLGKCPRCGKPVIEGKNGYGCSGYKDGCSFIIWKKAKAGMMSRQKVTKGVVKTLLKGGWIPLEDDEADMAASGVSDIVGTADSTSIPSDVVAASAAAGQAEGASGTIGLADAGAAGSEDGAGILPAAISGAVPADNGAFGPSGAVAFETDAILTPEDSAGTGSEAGRPAAMRTKNIVHLKRLYSEKKDKIYSADVYLKDDPSSPYGPSFAIAGFSEDEPEIIGKCPRCGLPVYEDDVKFGCSGYPQCRFAIWKHQKQKILAAVSFTKTDARAFLRGKPVRKRKLLDKKGKEFTAQLIMEETPDNPYGPVFRVLEGTIEVIEGEDPAAINVDTVTAQEGEKK